ncbi:reverse transcriptase [candidate division KSB1 bacterium]|nr:reverse transcriptase [candidate division KSB1 bacterium]
MRTALKYIEIVRERGEHGLILKRVYKNILNRELFLMAYANLYANNGATTKGVDPNDTVDGMSIRRIDRLIKKLRRRRYKWKPARRTHIDKRHSNKKRPLGIPGWNDKLIEEVLRIVLSAYYDVQFSVHSHGFRNQHGCHTALQEIAYQWTGTRWFIEGDIKGCFDNIDHGVLLELIGRKVQDRSLLKLLKGMLEAGYIEHGTYHNTYSGTPQGGNLSPLLANIVLHELDTYIEQELIPEYTKGTAKRRDPEYNRLNMAMTYAKQKGQIAKYNELRKRKRNLPSQLTNDPDYRRLRYVRYADDFLLGFIGSKAEAEAIKRKIDQFLKTLKLEMSAEKTLITHATTGRAKFLGYEITVAQSDERYTKNYKREHKVKRRSINGCVILLVPKTVINTWSRHFSRNGKVIHRSCLLRCSDFEIVLTFGIEFQGLVNYYALAHNISSLSKVKYHYATSLAKTLAAKHKKRVWWAYRKYKRISADGISCFMVEVKDKKNPERIHRAQFGNKPLRRQKTAIIKDRRTELFRSGNELIKRLLANQCELCGSDEDVQGHHVRKLKDVKEKYKNRKEIPNWVYILY